MNIKIRASRCYMKNGYLYRPEDIKRNKYTGNFEMRFWKFILGLFS